MNKIMKVHFHRFNISKLIHEINQPLTAIKAYLGGCELRLQKNDLSAEQMINAVQKINKHTELLQHKISSMQELIAQENPVDTQSIDALIAEIIFLYSYEMEHYNIELILNLQDHTPALLMDKFPIKHVLFRILKKCITTVEKNKIQNSKLEIQTTVQKDTIKIIIISNCFMEENDLEKELTYCRTFFNVDNGTLSADLLTDGICFQIMIYH
ncbi:histidine kinase [Fluoribacter dumoffii]|uniref:histidine kinase n=1 Tax=Fluoribacter dumoffii TaxID=463 RepID=UPI00026C7EDA|nr:histidine kinase [Fluoribacter dumoffii]